MTVATFIACHEIRWYSATGQVSDWGRLLGRTLNADGRICYEVQFADGDCVLWPVNDSKALYQFR